MKATDGHYLLANREYERLAGRPMAELKGQQDHDLFDREVAELLPAHEEEALATRGSIEFEAVASGYSSWTTRPMAVSWWRGS